MIEPPWPTRDADLSFTVYGTPQHQGNHRSNKHGGIYETNKNLAPWRSAAASVAHIARSRARIERFPAGVLVKAIFIYARPASHFGTGRNAGILKPSAPIYKDTAPDTDKLQRAVGDSLKQGGVIHDDARIVDWRAPKLWGDADRVEISIWQDTGTVRDQIDTHMEALV